MTAITRIGALAIVITLSASTTAEASSVCYQLPFGNPNLADGWGSTKGGRANPHRGVDFPQASGTKIPAVADGTVVLRTKTSCLGNVVVLHHADGMFSGYAHMQAQSTVSVGTKVKKGAVIGRVGTTGTCSTGPHLHLTLGPTRGSYAAGTTVDPYKYIKAHQSCASSDDSVAGIFTFSSNGSVPGQTCVRLEEPADTKTWNDNYLCTKKNIGLRWSYDGPIGGMRCTNVDEPAEHVASKWSDNFLCLPPSSPYHLDWSVAGKIAGKTCVAFRETADLGGSWGDNFLCYTTTRTMAAAGAPIEPADAETDESIPVDESPLETADHADAEEAPSGGCTAAPAKGTTSSVLVAFVAVVVTALTRRRRRSGG